YGRLPGEPAGLLGGELIVQRFGIVIVDEHECIADGEPVIGLEDQFVATGGNVGAHIEFDVFGHGGSSFIRRGQVPSHYFSRYYSVFIVPAASPSTAVDYCPTADAHGDYHRPQPCCRSAPHPAVTYNRHHEFTRRHPAKRHTAAAGVDESTVVGEDPRCILRPCIHRVHHRARLRPLRGRRHLDRCGGARGAHHLSADGPPLRRPLRLHGLSRPSTVRSRVPADRSWQTRRVLAGHGTLSRHRFLPDRAPAARMDLPRCAGERLCPDPRLPPDTSSR